MIKFSVVTKNWVNAQKLQVHLSELFNVPFLWTINTQDGNGNSFNVFEADIPVDLKEILDECDLVLKWQKIN